MYIDHDMVYAAIDDFLQNIVYQWITLIFNQGFRLVCGQRV